MREWGVTVVPEEALNELQGDVEIRRRGVFVGRSFYILDPSGNRLELYSPTLPPDAGCAVGTVAQAPPQLVRTTVSAQQRL
jgi:hypothetical protein